MRTRLVALSALLFVIATHPALASATDLGPSLNLGPIPVTVGTPAWSLAAPLGSSDFAFELDSNDDRISVFQAPDGDTWIAVEANRVGPFSALVRRTSSDGIEQHILIAGECIELKSDEHPSLLFVARDGRAPVRRMIRCGSDLESVVFDGVARGIGSADDRGWQLVRIPAPVGTTEKHARLVTADGNDIGVQVSLMESITTLATANLPQGWTYGRVRALRESLDGRALRARIAVAAVRDGARLLRLYDARTAVRGREARLIARGDVQLPAIDPSSPHKMLRLRAYDTSVKPPLRQNFLLRMARDRAYLIDPRIGAVDQMAVRGLSFSGAAARSSIRENRLFAVRSDLRAGRTFLRRWWASFDGSTPRLHGRLFEIPLEERLQVANLRAADLRSWVNRDTWPESPVRESLLLLGTSRAGGRGETPLAVYELRARRDGSGTLAFARRRYVSPMTTTGGVPVAKMDWLHTPSVSAVGYPRSLQITGAPLRAHEVVSLNGVGSRFTGRSYVRGTTHRITGSGFGLDPAVFFRSSFDGRATTLRRQILTGEEMVTRARGTIRGRRAIRQTTSARGRHSYLLTDDGVGGVEGRYSIRLLSNGLAASTNLPPRVHAGPDLSVRSASRRGRLVRLRARAADANGDQLAIRWSAPGITFTDPTGLVTEAIFPPGRTQVRIRARETEGTAPYEDADIVDVLVSQPTAVQPPSEFMTALRGIHPNPANPRTRIAFTVGQREHVRICIYDMAGRRVRELLSEVRGPGAYDEVWDGTDDHGQTVSSGVYPVRLSTSNRVDTQRAVLVR